MNRDTVLSVILAGAAAAVLLQVTPPYIEPNLKVTIYKNKERIRSVHQVRRVEYTKTLTLDKLDLETRKRLEHPTLGEIAFGERYFMDVEAAMDVRIAGEYVFAVGSDDGFALYIDNRLVCEHPGDRAMAYDKCPAVLEKGNYNIKLSYFQGFGQSGLRATYLYRGNSRDRETYFIGERSRYIAFLVR